METIYGKIRRYDKGGNSRAWLIYIVRAITVVTVKLNTMWTDGVMTFLRPSKLWRVYVCLIILSYWAMSASVLPETSSTVTACRGELFPLSCPGGIIAVGGVAYGYKNYFDTQLNELCYNDANFDSTCCTVDVADCQIDVEDLPETPIVQGQVELIYQSITGKSSPSVSAADVNNDICYLNEDVTDPQRSHYMQIQYYCIPDERIVSSPATNSDLSSSDGSALYLYNDPFVAGTCSVEVDSCTATLEMYTIALNLYNDSNGCQHSINVTEGDVTKTLTCDDNTFYTIEKSTATSNYVVITFHGSNAGGENVEAWMGFRAPDGTPLHVNCPAADQVYCNPCPQPEAPANGHVSTPNGVTFGQTAVYSCNDGYILDGVTPATCLETGAWSSGVPSCTADACPQPEAPANGTVSTPNGVTFGQNAVYTCSVGYILDGVTTATCLETGEWSSGVPSCTVHACPQPEAPANGAVSTPNGVTVGQTAVYTCNEGFLVKVTTATCLETGTWSSGVPSCTARGCDDPSPCHGKATGSFTYPSTANITCDPGYPRKGNATISCLATGAWSSNTTCGGEGVRIRSQLSLITGLVAAYK